MLEVNDGRLHFRGLPTDIISEIGFALTALLADAPSDVRPSMKKIMERCFSRAVTVEAIEAFLDDRSEFAEELKQDTRQFSIFSILSEVQERMKEEIAQEEEEENECE